MKAAFLRAMTSGTGLVRAEGKVLTMGRRVALAEGKLVGADGRPKPFMKGFCRRC